MIKEIKSFILPLLVLVAVLAPQISSADGLLIKKDFESWDYLGETNQQAFINYEEGLQKMIISVGMEETSDSAFWIFPVPADPGEVAIDVVTEFPEIRVEEISERAKDDIDKIKEWVGLTQVYPIAAFMEYYLVASVDSGGVVVHERIEEEGIIVEIITTKKAEALYYYLQEKGLNIEEGSMPVLDYYIGEEFTFVVSWILPEEDEEKHAEQRGVFTTFPTDKMYYPLLPTSVYGSKIVPASIVILGHRSPEIFDSIKSYTDVNYFIGSFYGEEMKDFYSGPRENVKYTRVDIGAPSKYLTQDLWIKAGAPLKTYYTMAFINYPLIFFLILLIAISALTGALTGMIVFREKRNKKGAKEMAILGLANCFSLIGIIIRVIMLKRKEEDDSVRETIEELKRRGYFFKRKLAGFLAFGSFLLPFFSVFFLTLIYDMFFRGMPYSGFMYNLIIIITFILPVLFLIIIFFLTRTKKEDRDLLQNLKENNYSTFFFVPKENSIRWVFVPLYSILFLMITSAVFEAIKITV